MFECFHPIQVACWGINGGAGWKVYCQFPFGRRRGSSTLWLWGWDGAVGGHGCWAEKVGWGGLLHRVLGTPAGWTTWCSLGGKSGGWAYNMTSILEDKGGVSNTCMHGPSPQHHYHCPVVGARRDGRHHLGGGLTPIVPRPVCGSGCVLQHGIIAPDRRSLLVISHAVARARPR